MPPCSSLRAQRGPAEWSLSHEALRPVGLSQLPCLSAASYGVSVMMLWDYFYRTAAWGHFACAAMNYSAPICVLGESRWFFWGGSWRKKELLFFKERQIKRPLPFYMKRHLRCTFCCQRSVLGELFKFMTELPAPTLPPPSHTHTMCHTLLSPASSSLKHLDGWMHWLCRLRPPRKRRMKTAKEA